MLQPARQVLRRVREFTGDVDAPRPVHQRRPDPSFGPRNTWYRVTRLAPVIANLQAARGRVATSVVFDQRDVVGASRIATRNNEGENDDGERPKHRASLSPTVPHGCTRRGAPIRESMRPSATTQAR